jgi:cytochrome c biogenesis protein CcmG/thiol:disulfide interchange protein DsbE
MLTWRAAFGEIWRSAARHKVATGVVTACVAGSFAAIAWAGTASGGTSGSAAGKAAADPVAPTFSFPVLGHSGQQISLRDYAGRPLIVNFFASWCTACQGETPLLAKFYRGEHGRVALVGLDENDGVTSALKFTKATGVSYPVGFDPQLIAASAYGVAALPQTFFLDAQHRIVDRIIGAVTTAGLSKGIALATRGSPK